MLITADHGNAECMYDINSKQNHTAHTTNRVPLIYIGHNATFSQEQGGLFDVAPTLISLLGLEPPPEMTGKSLLIFQTATNTS